MTVGLHLPIGTPTPRPLHGRERGGPSPLALLSALATVAVGSALLLGLDLRPPDLAAQTARAAAAGQGVGLWWNGWFGGVATATYSLLSGRLMAAVGVSVVAVASALVIAGASVLLLRHSRRPLLASALAGACATADLLAGRVTFALGAAAALAALVCLQRRRTVPAMVLALVTGLASPLAALGLAAAGVATCAGTSTGSGRRRPALLLTVAGVAPVLVVALFFPGPSVMPYGAVELLPALAVCAVLVVWSSESTVRWFAAISLLTAVGAFLVASPIGSNAGRWPLLAGPPLIAGYLRLDRRLHVGLIALACAWTGGSLTGDLASSLDPSGRPAYYTGLLARLGDTPVTGRIEVVDPVTHGADVYLSARYALARGWERQLDFALNPLFYAPTLSAQDYRAWLDANAVQYVAISSDDPDYGSRTEAALVDAHPDYLRQVWSDGPWRLFQVQAATPLVTGVAAAVAVGSDGVTLRSDEAGVADADLRYTPLLSATNTVTGAVVPVEPVPDDPSRSRLTLPGPGTWDLHG